MARFVQEFLGHRQIARRFPNAHVAQIGRQVRKKTLDILSFSIPGHKPSDGERMPEVMKTWLVVETVRAFHAGFISDAFERQLCGQMRDRASIVRGQKRSGGRKSLSRSTSSRNSLEGRR